MATNKRTFDVKITLKPEVTAQEDTVSTTSEVITLEDEQAQNFWAMYQSYLNGQGDAIGFTYWDKTVLEKPSPTATEVIAKTILFENVKTVERMATQTTSTTDYDCKDLELC
jgi:hypothetical protein